MSSAGRVVIVKSTTQLLLARSRNSMCIGLSGRLFSEIQMTV